MQPDSIAPKHKQKSNAKPFRGSSGIRVIWVPPFGLDCCACILAQEKSDVDRGHARTRHEGHGDLSVTLHECFLNIMNAHLVRAVCYECRLIEHSKAA